MGVPSLYRWLTTKWPKVADIIFEELPQILDNDTFEPDTSLPNPNNIEFDNLYLDMNGIIHPCVHPDDRPAPETQEEMFRDIFLYIDRLFNIIRPRRLLFMAIDGTAPRAKMNQQRSRRFRASQEAQDKRKAKEELLEQRKAGGHVEDDVEVKKSFDTNQITPGTQFMFDLAEALRFYISQRISKDSGWKNVKVVLSDANVPGEGEHKIMDFIRSQRISENYDPNTRHVLYGLDADLIMLGMATHEPHFFILRENVFSQGEKSYVPLRCEYCHHEGHLKNACKALEQIKQGKQPKISRGVPKIATSTTFLTFNLSILREYLYSVFCTVRPQLTKLKFDFERIIDDYIFLCFLVGNDFLPHVPSLSIREGSIDLLCSLYLSCLPHLTEYLTYSGDAYFTSISQVIQRLGSVEDRIFKLRFEIDERKQRAKERREGVSPVEPQAKKPRLQTVESETFNQHQQEEEDQIVSPDLEASDGDPCYDVSLETTTQIVTRHASLHDPQGRVEYYKVKFEFDVTTPEGVTKLEHVCHCYAQGLAWTLKYYYQGCPSWRWFYPYHYAPLAQDLAVYIGTTSIDFDPDTRPFLPAEQLLAVFPRASSDWIPPSYRELMLTSSSPLADFYPEHIILDKEPNKPLWQAVVLLPFIDEAVFLQAIEENNCFERMDKEDKLRNMLHPNLLFVHKDHKLASTIVAASVAETPYEPIAGCQIDSYRQYITKEITTGTVPFNAKKGDGIVGYVKDTPQWKLELDQHVKSPLPFLSDLESCQCLCAALFFKDVPVNTGFAPVLLPGAILPRQALTAADLAYKPYNRHAPISEQVLGHSHHRRPFDRKRRSEGGQQRQRSASREFVPPSKQSRGGHQGPHFIPQPPPVSYGQYQVPYPPMGPGSMYSYPSHGYPPSHQPAHYIPPQSNHSTSLRGRGRGRGRGSRGRGRGRGY
ncbi:hypothetical protein P9112_010724 [Eukaryota sp. TZLM1-RC]